MSIGLAVRASISQFEELQPTTWITLDDNDDPLIYKLKSQSCQMTGEDQSHPGFGKGFAPEC